MLEAKPSRLSRAVQLGARKSPAERGSLPPVPPSPSRPRVPQRGRAGPSQGRSPPPRGCPTRRGGVWRRGSSARARALKPCRAHAGFLQKEKCLCSACPTVDPGQNLSPPSPPPRVTKFVVFITYFPSCACFQVYTVLQLEWHPGSRTRHFISVDWGLHPRVLQTSKATLACPG